MDIEEERRKGAIVINVDRLVFICVVGGAAVMALVDWLYL